MTSSQQNKETIEIIDELDQKYIQFTGTPLLNEFM